MRAEDERVKPRDGSELEPRPHAVDIYERVCDDTVEELRRPPSSLAFSGLFAGFTIALAPLAYALALVTLGEGESQKFAAALVYPIGYIAVIIGRAQFFTENTLYPVTVTMRKPEFLTPSSRLWAIVYAWRAPCCSRCWRSSPAPSGTRRGRAWSLRVSATPPAR
jgi:formate/nitrite transporter FocA (FNT family)